MKFCPYCGAYNNNPSGKFCEYCGSPINNGVNPNQNINQNYNPQNNNVLAKDEYPFLWGILGFFIPIGGLVIYILWKKERPKSAKAAGLGALIRAILIVITIILTILFAIFVEPSKEKNNNGRYYPYENRERYEDDWA